MILSCATWLGLLKLFVLSVSARKASEEMKISCKTALKAFDLVRRSILEELARKDKTLQGEMELDEAVYDALGLTEEERRQVEEGFRELQELRRLRTQA